VPIGGRCVRSDSARNAGAGRRNTRHLKGATMRKLVITTVTVGALAASALGLAGVVAAAPSGPGSAHDTLNLLQGEGYGVIVNRVSNAPLDQCTKPPRRLRPRQPATGWRDSGCLLVQVIRYTTVYEHRPAFCGYQLSTDQPAARSPSGPMERSGTRKGAPS